MIMIHFLHMRTLKHLPQQNNNMSLNKVLSATRMPSHAVGDDHMQSSQRSATQAKLPRKCKASTFAGLVVVTCWRKKPAPHSLNTGAGQQTDENGSAGTLQQLTC